MSIDGTTVPQLPVDLTNIGHKEEKKQSILPPALLAAKALNKKNNLGTIEVHLPVLNVTVKTVAFSGINDTIVKTISGSISSYNDANFRLLYNHIIFPEECNITTYEDFKSKLTEADFRAALFGVMNASFKTLEENKFVCRNEKCPNPDENKVFPFAPKMNQIKIDFPREAYVSPSGDHTLDLFIAETDILKINYKFDAIDTKIKMFQSRTNDEIRNNIINVGTMLPKTDLTINYIDSIEVNDGEETYKISQPEDIALFIRSLDVTSREEIENLNSKFITHIDGWIPRFSTEITCPHCKTSQTWEDIDIYVEFFRKFTTIF